MQLADALCFAQLGSHMRVASFALERASIGLMQELVLVRPEFWLHLSYACAYVCEICFDVCIHACMYVSMYAPSMHACKYVRMCARYVCVSGGALGLPRDAPVSP